MNVLSILENRRCYLCGGQDDGESGLCSSCKQNIIEKSRKKGTICVRCSQPLSGSAPDLCSFCSSIPVVDRLYSVSYFNSYMKELLTLFKSGKLPGLRYFFASLLFNSLKEQNLLHSLIIPIPPRRGKIKDQGWDQVDLLCNTLKRVYGLKIAKIMKRTDRVQQKSLNFDEREEHMKSILRIKDTKSCFKDVLSVVLLDDIFTSGATISAAAELIRQNYNGELTAVVLCSVI